MRRVHLEVVMGSDRPEEDGLRRRDQPYRTTAAIDDIDAPSTKPTGQGRQSGWAGGCMSVLLAEVAIYSLLAICKTALAPLMSGTAIAMTAILLVPVVAICAYLLHARYARH